MDWPAAAPARLGSLMVFRRAIGAYRCDPICPLAGEAAADRQLHAPDSLIRFQVARALGAYGRILYRVTDIVMARARVLIIRNADDGIYVGSNFFERARHGTLLCVPRRGTHGAVKEPRFPRHGGG
jgi:hypothetical protein